MQYLLMIYGNEAHWSTLSDADRQAILEEYGAYTGSIHKTGHYRGGNELADTTTATTVRVRDGKRTVTDGPFAETKEQLGGYYMIDVPGLDAALSWASRCPGATHGAIEVRPIWPMM